MKLFRHKHDWRQAEFVYHCTKVMPYPAGAPVATAKVYRCKCGAERRELTPAGHQQQGWGDNIDELLGLK